MSRRNPKARPARSPGPRRVTCLALLAWLGCAAFPCAAQQTAGVTLRFLSFPKEIEPPPVELLLGEGKTTKIEIPSNELSGPYKVPPLAAWVVGETTKGPEGKAVFKEFGRAKALASPSPRFSATISNTSARRCHNSRKERDASIW